MSNPIKKINADVRSFVEQANLNQRGTRTVPLGTALEVARRSLASTETESFSVRKFRALSDVSEYISLVQRNKWNSTEPRNADLLPVAHPASTRKHRMSELQVLKSRARWYADDPRVTDERVRPLLATAFTAEKDSPEYEYAVARLSAMGSSQVPLAALVAAFNDGANRGFWRRQLRDRFGRFAEMGGGLRVLINRANGRFRMNGTVVSTNSEDNTFVIERPDGELVEVPAVAGEAVEAFLPSESTPDGFSKEPVSAGSDEPSIDEADLVFVDQPAGFRRVEDVATPVDDEGPEVWLDDLDNYQVAKVGDGQFLVSRWEAEEGEAIPFAAVKSWAEAQDAIEKDEPLYRRGEDPILLGDLEEAGAAPVPTEEEAVDADLAEIERDQQSLPDEEIAAGFGFDPEPGVENEWDGGEDENGNRIIVQKISDDNWNIAAVVDDGDVRDVAQAEGAYDAFDQANAMRQSPREFDAGAVADLRQDEADKAEEVYMTDRGEYEPAGPDAEVESEDYTDDPADLATRFEPEVLAESLKESVEDGSGLARLEFEEGDEDVPSEAIYNALKEQGADVDDFLDSVEEGREAEITIPEADEAEEARARLGDRRRNADAVALRELLGDDMPAVLQGLSDRELQELIDNDFDYRNYVSAPENIDAPEGFYKLEEDAVDPGADIPGAPEGIQPFQFAVEFKGEELEAKFREAMSPGAERPGYAKFDMPDEDGEAQSFDVPAEVMFDALELNGIDANELVNEIYGGDVEPTPEEIQETVDGEDVTEEELEEVPEPEPTPEPTPATEPPAPEDIENAEAVFGGLNQEQKDELIKSTKEGGYTVNFVSGEVPQDGYMVAAEADIPAGPDGFRKREEVVSFADFDAEPAKYLDAFARRNVDKLEQDGYYIGTWVDTDEDGNQWVYFDVSERFTDKEEALQAAEERGEIAAFGIAEFEEFFVDPEREAQKNGEQEAGEADDEPAEELPGDVGPGAPSVGRDDSGDAAGEPEEGPGQEVAPEEPVESAPPLASIFPAEGAATPPEEPGYRKVFLDFDKDLRPQIEDAIEKGNVIVFFYREKVRYVEPQSIWENPRNGNINVYGADLGDDYKKKNFTLDKFEALPEGTASPSDLEEALEFKRARAEAGPAPEDVPEEGDQQTVEDFMNEIEERQRDLLRSEGRNRNNLPPIPEKYRRQVYIRLLAGLYADENGNPLADGDRVMHRRPDMQAKYGEGKIIDKVQGEPGGLQRKGVVYVDYVLVEFPGFDEPKKLAARFLRHQDEEVARERFEAEPRINWMNEQEMREALVERAKKPRKPKNAEEAQEQVEIQEVADSVASKAQEAEPAPDFNLNVDDEVDVNNLIDAPNGAEFVVNYRADAYEEPTYVERWQKVNPQAWLVDFRGRKRFVPVNEGIAYLNNVGRGEDNLVNVDDIPGNSYVVDPARFDGTKIVRMEQFGQAENFMEYLAGLPDASAPDREAVAAAPSPEVPERSEPLDSGSVDRVERLFREQGNAFVDANAQRVEGAEVRDIQTGDFVLNKKGDYGRVVELRTIPENDEYVERIAIKVQYANGDINEYRPYRANSPINELWRLPEGERPEPAQPAEAPQVLSEDEDRQVPVPRAAAMTPEEMAEIDNAYKDLAKLRREIGPQKNARGYSDQAFIKYVQHLKKSIDSGNIRRARNDLENAKRLIKDNRYYSEEQREDYAKRLDALDKLLDAREGGVPFNGPPLEELDPLEVKEQRISDNVNAVELGSFWRQRILSDEAFEDYAQKGNDIRQYREELRDFFSGEAKPLAALSEGARYSLQSLVDDRLADRDRSDEERANLREIAELGYALQREKLAYEPNESARLDARGALLLEFTPGEIWEAAHRGVALERNGVNLGFEAKVADGGGGRQGDNETIIVKDLQTGKTYYFKTDTNSENIDAEIAANALGRALGMQGMYPAERHPGDDRAVVLGGVGQNLKLKKEPLAFGKYGMMGGNFVDKAAFVQSFNMMVMDAVMHNNDRHGMNFHVGQVTPVGQKPLANQQYVALPIDNGLGQAIARSDDGYGDVRNPVEYIMGTDRRPTDRNDGFQNALVRRLGAQGMVEMMQVSTQQAIQALRREYPAGSNPDIDVLVGRLEELRNADLEDWS